MDKPIPGNLPTGHSDLSFQVMPQGSSSAAMSPNSGTPSAPKPPGTPSLGGNLPPEHRSGVSRLPYIIIAIAVLAALGALAYFLLGSGKTEEPAPEQSKLPKAWMTLYFNTEVCSDQNVCGDDADPDNDGLKNFEEFKEGGNPINPDTDSDGLADGDEVNVYLTDPALKYTDRRDIVSQNDWSDGFQIKNGFDPLNPGFKFTDQRTAKISENSEKFGLHEPTITTLKSSVTAD